MRLKNVSGQRKIIWNYEIRRNTQKAEEAPTLRVVKVGRQPARGFNPSFSLNSSMILFSPLRQMSEKNKKVVDKRVNIW